LWERRSWPLILLTFEREGRLRLGIKTPEGVLDVAAAQSALALDDIPATPDALFRQGSSALAALSALAAGATGKPHLYRDEAELQLGPCVPNPGKIICIGLNYRPHAAEADMPVPAYPILFSKFGNAIAASGEPVPLPANAVEYDYEVELAVVMGRRARYVGREEALEYVLGYCCANDLSTRDLQFRTDQWLLGKSQDKFLPIGPYLVTAQEVGDPQNLTLRLWVNGELRQHATTAEMIFPVSEIISYISQHFTLEPGDIIATGTPEGVVLGMKEKVWLKPGDEVEAEVEGLGRLTNRMVAEHR